MRLNKFLASCGLGTRRECDKIIAEGVVTVNGEVSTEYGLKVGRNDRVECRGKRLFSNETTSILFNKERDIHTNFTKGEESLVGLIKEMDLKFMEGFQPLVYSDCGVQILTNDLELLQSKRPVQSVFHILLSSAISSDQENLLSEFLHDKYEKVKLAVINTERTELGLELSILDISELYSAFEQFKVDVNYCDRVLMNGVSKKDLNRGFYRTLQTTEVIRLKHF